MSIAAEVTQLAELAAKFFEGISSGRIPLQDAEAFVTFGRIDEAPGLPPIGSKHNLSCPKCRKDTPHTLTEELHGSDQTNGVRLLRWTCSRCKRKGPIARMFELREKLNNWRTTRRE